MNSSAIDQQAVFSEETVRVMDRQGNAIGMVHVEVERRGPHKKVWMAKIVEAKLFYESEYFQGRLPVGEFEWYDRQNAGHQLGFSPGEEAYEKWLNTPTPNNLKPNHKRYTIV